LSGEGSSANLETLNKDVRRRLADEVSGMSMDNFLVRAKRKPVEHFQKPEAWSKLSSDDREALKTEIAGLPTALQDDDIAAKQFDWIILSGQLALVRNQPNLECKTKVMTLAAKLEELSNIPMVATEMETILRVQTAEFWQIADAWELEMVRRRLRSLIKLIEGGERHIVYTNFEDEIGEGSVVGLSDVDVGTDKARFRMKVRHFLQQHADHVVIHKLRRNEQLTPQDLSELERIMVEEGVASTTDLEEVRSEGGLGIFIRSLVGLERDAAKAAFADFMNGKNLNSNQIEFIDLIIDHLTERGAMDARRLYESPFTDLDDQGVSGLFPQADVQLIIHVLGEMKKRAAA